uniref:Transmembrane domain-containing protein n=1 Tax=Caenorhabditis tropicalis TaxID=1561998 RepID=A0A1I7V1M2_9PELO
MKNDVTKTFLAIVYMPLGISSIFKVALAVYSILEGAYGWWYMTFLMFYNWLYTTAVVSTAIGSVVFLAALIVIARKRQNFNPCDSWTSYSAVLFFAALISGSYHFISYQWNQLPGASLFFTYILATIGIVAELLVCLCVGLLCRPRTSPGTNVAVLTGDPVVDDARTRLAYGALAVIVMTVPMVFEIYVKITELFTPYLWDSDEQKTVFYTAQSKLLLTFDTIRLFLSLFMLIPLFITSSGRFAIGLWIRRKPHPTAATANKVFVATQNQPLLMDTGEKKTPPPPTPPEVPAPPAPPVVTQQPPLVPIPHQVPVNQPPMYPGIGFAPGMLQLPHNMQTTIVYTPQMAYENLNGQIHTEQFK